MKPLQGGEGDMGQARPRIHSGLDNRVPEEVAWLWCLGISTMSPSTLTQLLLFIKAWGGGGLVPLCENSSSE